MRSVLLSEREAFEDMLRCRPMSSGEPKKFAEGAGSYRIFAQIAQSEISDEQFNQGVSEVFEDTGHHIRSKEELFYYRVYRRFFKASTVPLVGFSRSL